MTVMKNSTATTTPRIFVFLALAAATPALNAIPLPCMVASLGYFDLYYCGRCAAVIGWLVRSGRSCRPLHSHQTSYVLRWSIIQTNAVASGKRQIHQQFRAMPTRKTSPLPRTRSRGLVQEVMDDLTAKIRGGLYKPGAKLPTEPEVMAEQGVSRTVVREAVSRLQAAGFVETRHGVGTFVLATSAAVTPALDLSTVVTIRDVVDMLELRISLEAEAAGLAALRRTDAHLVLMRAAVDAFDERINAGEKAVEEDFQFHLQIALATGNRYFEDVYRHLGKTTIPRTRIDTALLLPEPGPTYLHRTNGEHRNILDAIARRDPDTARAAMRLHLTNSRERLKRVGGLLDGPAMAGPSSKPP